MSSLIRRAKRSQSRQNICTAAELVSYIRQRVSDFTGQRRKAWTENRVEGKVKKKLKTADINTLFYVKVNDTRLLFFSDVLPWGIWKLSGWTPVQTQCPLEQSAPHSALQSPSLQGGGQQHHLAQTGAIQPGHTGESASCQISIGNHTQTHANTTFFCTQYIFSFLQKVLILWLCDCCRTLSEHKWQKRRRVTSQMSVVMEEHYLHLSWAGNKNCATTT